MSEIRCGQTTSLRSGVLNGVPFCPPQGTVVRSKDIISYHSWAGVTAISWVEARDAAKYPLSTGQHPQWIKWPQMSTVLRLKDLELDVVCASIPLQGKGPKMSHWSFPLARPFGAAGWLEIGLALFEIKSICLPFEKQSDGKSTREKKIILSHLKHELINKYLCRNFIVHRHCTGPSECETLALS